MIRLILLLCAGGWLYSLVQTGDSPAAQASARVSALAAVARAGAGWAADAAIDRTRAAVGAEAGPEPAAPARRGLKIVFEPEVG